MRAQYPHLPAHVRIGWARQEREYAQLPYADALGKLEPWGGHRVTLDNTGALTVTIAVEPDYDIDMSWLGTFTDRYEDGAIRVPDRHVYAPSAFAVPRWFVPAIGYRERREMYSRLGYSRGVADYRARREMWEDMRTAIDYSPYGVVVTVSLEGIELGHDSLWQCDYDDPGRVVFDHDMIGEALSDARDSLASLTANVSDVMSTIAQWGGDDA